MEIKDVLKYAVKIEPKIKSDAAILSTQVSYLLDLT